MEIETRKQKAAAAAEAWRRQYCTGKATYAGDALRIWSSLLALGAAPEPDEVDYIIGNKSWTACTCNECRRDVDAVVRVGDEPDYESSTAWLCSDCITKAAVMITTAEVG